MTEFELKFQVPEGRLAEVEAALRRGPVQRTRLRARYFDTPGEALARRQLVLRLRQEGRRWVQTAKGPTSGTFERLEHDVALPAGVPTVPDPRLHAGHPVGALLQQALEDAHEDLQPVFETDVWRLTRVVEAAGTAVEIALDQGHIRAGRRSAPVCELEFERKRGSAGATVELARSWSQAHGLWLDPLSKSALGHRLAAGAAEPPPVMAPPQRGVPGDPGQLLAGVLASALEQILGNARELAAGTGGDEHVHQLRVGLRRLRTVLRELGDAPGLQTLDPQVEPAVRALFLLLGEHRDRAALIPALEREVQEAGGPAIAWRPALPDPGAGVRDADFQSALLHLLALVQALGAGDAPTGGSLKALRKSVRARLAKLHRQVVRDGLRFEALQEARRHRVRKRLKRLRYLAELMRPLFAGKEVDRFVKSLKRLQDALGSYQDAATGRRLFTERAADDPACWFAAGWLAAREREIAADCAAACRAFSRKSRPFWY